VAPRIPESEDYLFPTPEPAELSNSEAQALRSAWRDVLSGDVASASRRLERLRRRAAGRPSLETALAYASLRAGRLEEASTRFAAVLERAAAFTPALVGAGASAARRGDADSALGLYRRAQAASPGDALVRKRVAALKLQVTERHMARAQSALAAGDAEAAGSEYRLALETAPEVTGVRLALADLLLAHGDAAGAIAVLQADPGGDRQVTLRLGGVLVAAQQFERALDAYRSLLARDPGDAAARLGYLAARERLEAAAMPEEYRRIPEAANITRADLAALLVVKVKALRRIAAGEARVAVDISGSWAREQVASALALEIMDVYPNHTFQPGAVVRRVDVARSAARVLDLLRWPRAAGPGPADMPPSHLDYQAVERVLAAGLMGLSAEGTFEPWRAVSGREAIDVVEALARLLGP
jgi:tetratricopeptide (TPR) repeat protein